MKKTLKIILCALTLFVSITTYAEKITAAMSEWPPYFGDQLKLRGLATEIITQAMKGEGYKLDVEFIPWDRAMKNTKAGHTDILLGVWFSEERAKDYYYSDPYFTNRIVLIKLSDDKFEYKGLESLKDKKVGTLRNYYYSKSFIDANSFKKLKSSNLISNLKKLEAGRIDLAIADEYVARYIISKKMSSAKDKFEYMKKSIEEKPLHITISRSNPRGKELISTFNKALKKMHENGTYDRIIKDYGL